jgi:hypothetical protein
LIVFAIKYRKGKLLGELTPALLDLELQEVINILPPSSISEFCLFRDKWIKVLLACSTFIIDSSLEHGEENSNYPCSKKPETQITRILKGFLENAMAKPSLLFPEQLDRMFLQIQARLEENGCVWCKDTFGLFREFMLQMVNGLPRRFVFEMY